MAQKWTLCSWKVDCKLFEFFTVLSKTAAIVKPEFKACSLVLKPLAMINKAYTRHVLGLPFHLVSRYNHTPCALHRDDVTKHNLEEGCCLFLQFSWSQNCTHSCYTSEKQTNELIIIQNILISDIFYGRGSGSVLLWNAVKQAWSALFAPYHMIQAA